MLAVEMLRAYRRSFLIVFLICLTAGVFAISLMEKSFLVKSSIRMGAVLSGDQRVNLQPAADTAKLIVDLYLPFALSELQQEKVPLLSLQSVANLRADGVGEHVVLHNQVKAPLATVAVALHEKILRRVINDSVEVADLARGGAQLRLESAERAILDLSHQIENLIALSNKTFEREEAALAQLKDLQQDYSRKVNVQGVGAGGAEQATRELVQRIGSEEATNRDLTQERARIAREIFELRRAREDQIKIQLASQRELSTIREARVVERPTLLPIPIGPSRLSFLLAVIVISLLLAFGTIVTRQKIANFRAAPKDEASLLLKAA
ncbi:hypothetical protein [Bradyrhizobium sp. Arg816]|uniref:hypothetical protein n=1 Tax=Bradyrhizobium sp. Arg816 TaxID=2998491 RepID=UPI00249EDC65|nr:hypothetical protein [Bradyrhizobium sp. Arg816]MDI3563940.1 hypothetical protein [Bradyrhizobium sp. Arg816]